MKVSQTDCESGQIIVDTDTDVLLKIMVMLPVEMHCSYLRVP